MVTLQHMIKPIYARMIMSIILILLILSLKIIYLGSLPSPLRKNAKQPLSRMTSFYYHFWESIINGIRNTFIILMKVEISEIISLARIRSIHSPI